MAVSIDSSGQICFSVTEISLKPTRHYDLQDYVGSQTLVQLQVSSNPRLHLHLLNSLHQNGTEALYTKFQASYFLFLRQRKQSGFLAVIVRFVVNIDVNLTSSLT